jgi:two-component system phosphate regulon sensor histidine kinase PhoR
MIISLAGIISIQTFWLINAINVKQAQTDSTINEALTQVVSQIETKETVTVIAKNIDFQDSTNQVIPIKNKRIKKTNISLNSLEDIDELDDELEAIVEELEGQLSFKIDIETDDDQGAQEETFQISSAKQAVVISKENDNLSIEINKLVNSKKEQVDMVVRQLITEDILSDKPLEQRIDTVELLNDVKQALKNKGIHYDFDIAVIDEAKDSVVFTNTQNINDLKQTKYKTELFPNDIIEKDLILYLNIDEASSEIYKSVMLPMLGSGLFSLIIIIVFIVTLITIQKHKKLSEIKSDFINNITHEFKTPIATISLASDSIENEKIIYNPEQIRYFTNIIREENNRMNTQVEHVLQASMLEKDNLILNKKNEDVQLLISRAVKNIQLQIEQRKGVVNETYEAGNHFSNVDDVHFVNVINNLLDNAIKYSKEAPKINIKTSNSGGFLRIAISDQGIGMRKEVKKKIFDKFYRESHGNIHNIKGFGLGLSYVLAIVNKHGGNIYVESKEDYGSTFTIELPVCKTNL